MGKLDRAWQLFNQSFTVLNTDPEILLLPAMSGVSFVLVGLGFLFPLYRGGIVETTYLRKVSWESYAVLFAWYYVNFFIGIFFNAALAICANIRLSGGDPTVGHGLRIAFRRVGRIALWALIASTVGLFLSSMRRRGNWILGILGASLGLAWSLITYLIVPVLLFEERGVYDSVYRSEELFKDNWGEQITGDFGFGLLGFFLSLPAFLLAAFLWGYDRALAVIMAVCYLVILSVVLSAAKGVFTVALYRYATLREVPAGFSADIIDEALGVRP